MKLNAVDVLQLRNVLKAANKAGLFSMVIHEGKARGVSEARNAAIFSEFQSSIDPEVELGITRISELEKRLNLFGENVLIEIEVNDANKARKLSVRGKSGKIDFRCTDSKLITYPKTNTDSPNAVVVMTKPEAALLSKGARILGGDFLVVQVKRDGQVHMECSDVNNDRFELDLETPAEFIDDPMPAVHKYDIGTNGVLIPMIEHLAKDNDTLELPLLATGNFALRLFGFDMLAIPRIKTGE